MTSALSWDMLKARAGQLASRREQLLGQRKAMENMRQHELAKAVAAQERVQAGVFVQDILQRLQQREHQRAVGAYEQLLGAFLSDVLPGEREIVMDLHTDRGAPALDVFIRKGEQSPLEDWMGTGGSVTNLLSTGLRLVALLRSGQRRFLVLDESDCWLKPDLIPRYAGVVAQMAKDLRVQVLMISHHDESLFAQHISHRLRLEKNGSVLTAQWSPTSFVPSWDPAAPGMRSIELRNFQSHQHTIVPLSPEVTLLQGDNDIGKSAVVNALRAVFDGDANDTVIRHHAPSAMVTFDFGPDQILRWERFRKGKVKVSYKLLDPYGVALHASDTAKVPDWVTDTLKIGQVDGMDVQIGQQKEPVFLLNQPPSQRAKALSIGQESGHVNAMILLDKQDMQDAKATLKNSENTLETLRRQGEILAGLDDLVDPSPQLDGAQQRQQQWKALQDVGRRWQHARSMCSILQTLGAPAALRVPTPQSLTMATLSRQWRVLHVQTLCLGTLGNDPSLRVPVPQRLGSAALEARWKDVARRVDVLGQLGMSPTWGSVPQPQSPPAQRLHQQWSHVLGKARLLQSAKDGVALTIPLLQTPNMAKHLAQWALARQQHADLEVEVADAQEDVRSLQQDLLTQFPLCPTCHQHWDHQHF